MTLLLATHSPSEIVITGDGFSIKNEKEGRRAIGRTTLQKIFTDDKRLAIGHYGDNVDLEKTSIASIVKQFLTRISPTAAIRDVALDLRQKIHIAEGGIWVAGFESDAEYPWLYEVVWSKKGTSKPIELSNCALIVRGSGRQFLPAEHQAGMRDLEKVATYHDRVYDTALENQRRSNEPKCFGGHKHQLVLGRECIWRILPTERGLGFKEILDDLGVAATAAPDYGADGPQAAMRAQWCEFRQWCSQQLGCKRTHNYGGMEKRFSKKGLWKPVKTYADTALAMFDEADKCEPPEVTREDALLFAAYLQWLREQISAAMQ